MHLLNIRVWNREIIPGVAERQQNAILAEPLLAIPMSWLLKQQEAVEVVCPMRRQSNVTANLIG